MGGLEMPDAMWMPCDTESWVGWSFILFSVGALFPALVSRRLESIQARLSWVGLDRIIE